MIISVVKETYPGERRVALVPDALKPLLAAGVEVLVERGAGDGAAIPDQAYTDAGAKVVSRDDVYALACVSYELFCSRHPFDFTSSLKPTGHQYRRSISPVGVPGPTFVSSSFSSLDSIGAIPPLVCSRFQVQSSRWGAGQHEPLNV
jgi:serine/threonine protein kinase